MSQRGKVNTQYRRENFWPATPEQIALHALLMSWPLTGYARLRAKYCGPLTNVRAAL